MDNADNIIDIYTHFGVVGIFVLVLTMVIIAQFSDFGRRLNKIIVEKIFKGNKNIDIKWKKEISKKYLSKPTVVK